MRLIDAERLAIRLIAQHLLDTGYAFRFNNKVNSLGCCHYRAKVIELSSKWTTGLPESEIRDTILHEIAHALAYENHRYVGHGETWQSYAIRVGAKPQQFADLKYLGITKQDIIPYRYELIDTTTGNVVKRYHRVPSDRTFSSLKSMYLPSRKAETLGKLKIRKVNIDLMEL
jgi:predicted SprT family Zn-dependent metalloprotease